MERTKEALKVPFRRRTASNELLWSSNQLHTTGAGYARVRKNLSLDTGDVIGWCRETIKSPGAVMERRGDHWYVRVDDCVIVINAYSYIIITAHREKLQ